MFDIYCRMIPFKTLQVTKGERGVNYYGTSDLFADIYDNH